MNKYPMVKLGDICQILNGYAFQSDNYVNNGIRVIRITNVQKGFIEDNSPVYYPIEYEKDILKYMLYENDLLISLTGNVGRVALLDKQFLPSALNQRVGCIRINSNLIDKNYLFNILNSNKFENDCIYSSKGVAQKNLSTEWLKKYNILLPPIEEQHHIANVLDKVTAQIDNCNKILQNLDLLVKSKFVQMFGDPVSNPMGWEENLLNSLGELNRGVSKHRPRNDVSLLNGKYPLIQTGDIAKSNLYIEEYESTYSELGLKQSKMWEKGTLCITIAGNIAKTGILTFNACFPDSVVGFIGNSKVSQIFIHYWFSFFQKILEEQAPQVAQKNINLKILNNLIVITPPIELQNQFVEFVENVEKQKTTTQNTLNQLKTLKNALMQEYFS